jgi:hypothetical protein
VQAGRNVFDFILLPKSYEPEPQEKLRGHVTNQDYIKVDPAKLDPSLLDATKE